MTLPALHYALEVYRDEDAPTVWRIRIWGASRVLFDYRGSFETRNQAKAQGERLKRTLRMSAEADIVVSDS